MLKILSDLNDVISLKAELYRVYALYRELTFYSPTFVINSYRQFLTQEKKSELFFLLYLNDDKIMAYLPLYIDSNKTLRFIFDKHTDYCGVIGQSPDFDFFKDLSKVIKIEPKIKKIDLDNLSPNDSLINYFRQYFGSGVIISSYNNHSYISSQINIGYFTFLKSKYRSELKRVQNKTNIYQFKVFSAPDVFPLHDILMLKQKVVKKGWRNESIYNEDFMFFTQEMYKTGELILISEWDKDRLISIVFVFKNSGLKLFTFWLTLFDEDVQYINLSNYLNFISLKEKENNYNFSFGRGNYDFKTKFCPKIENLYNLRYSKSKLDFWFSVFYPIKLFAKRLIKE